MTSVSYPVPSEMFLDELRSLPQEYGYLIVFHLSKNNLPYLREWVEEQSVIGIISIPYSEQPEVKKELSEQVPVYSPKLKDIPNTIIEVCSAHADKKIILLEIGGYSSAISHLLPNVVCAIEDTTRGHEEFKKHANELAYPVVSIARTNGKKLEDDAVGRALAESVARIAESYSFVEHAESAVLVLGYGGVGKAVAQYLRDQGKQVLVHDTDPLSLDRASQDGFEVVERLKGLLRATIIVGCSGHTSLRREDFPHIQENAILISGSSKQIEFPYEEMLPYKDSTHSDSLLERFSDSDFSFYIAYRGQPINFYFDVPLGQVFDIPMTLLLVSVRYALREDLRPGFYELPESEGLTVLSTVLVDSAFGP